MNALSQPQQPDRSVESAEKPEKERLKKRYLEDADVEIERLESGKVKLGNIKIAPGKKRITFPAQINQVRGPIECLIVTEEGRVHESVLRTKIRPLHLQLALYLLGLDNGTRLPAEEHKGTQGDLVNLDILWQTEEGEPRSLPIERWVLDTRTEKRMECIGWVFVGSPVVEGTFLADRQGNVALVWSVGATVLDIPDPESDNDMVFEAKAPAKGPDEIGREIQVRVTPVKENNSE